MRYLSIVLLVFFTLLGSCDTTTPTGLALDDLKDKQEYTGSITVDCSFYKGESVEKIVVNGNSHNDPSIIQVHTAENS